MEMSNRLESSVPQKFLWSQKIENYMESQFHLEPLQNQDLPKIYRIAVGAVGGQGGGAISEIIFYAVKYEREKFAPKKAKVHTYETRGMIPGLAQRSGSTITSVTFVDPTLTDDQLPEKIILTEMPHRGSCDLVVGQELNELMKFLPLVRDGGLALVNEERQITPPEKLSNFSPSFSLEDQIQAAKDYMKKGHYIGFSGKRIIETHSLDPRMINTFMLGIISENGILPISRESYLKAIGRRFSGRVFELNKEAFELGERYYSEGRFKDFNNPKGWDDLTLEEIINRAVNTSLSHRRFRRKQAEVRIRQKLENLASLFPHPINRYVIEAYGQLVDFQNEKHAKKYVDMIEEIFKVSENDPDLLTEYARNVAGRLMQWDGPIRVAEYAVWDKLPVKDERGRLHVMEKKLQPTLEEIVGMIPVPKFIYRHPIGFLYRFYERNMFRGVRLNTRPTGLIGFTTFWFLNKLKPIRPWMVRYHREMDFIAEVHENQMKWLSKSQNVAKAHAYYLGKIRGYSYVRHRHLEAYRSMINHLPRIYDEAGEDRCTQFIYHLYREISNAGHNYEKVDEIAEQYIKGDFQITLTPLSE